MARMQNKRRPVREEDIEEAIEEEVRPRRVHRRPSDDDERGGEAHALLDWSVTRDTQRGIAVIVFIAAGLLSLFSFFDLAGNFGRFVDSALGIFFGWARYGVPALLLILGYLIFHPDRYRVGGLNIVGLLLCIASVLGTLHLLGVDTFRALVAALDGQGGGYIGYLASAYLVSWMGFWATLVVLIAVFLASLLIMFNTSLERVFEQSAFWRRWYHALHLRWMSSRYGTSTEESTVVTFRDSEVGEHVEEEDVDTSSPPSPEGEGEAVAPRMPRLPKHRRVLAIPMELLASEISKPTVTDLEVASLSIQKTLESFGITVEMSTVHVGPTVTQFTLKPAEGVRLAEITALSNDLALALAAHPIRIEAPIPGKSLVGIEVPNQKVAIVTLGEIIRSEPYAKRSSNLMIALGKDVTGMPWLADLTRMPHLLVAGATGSGKSICLNTILVSLLYQNGPDDLKVILVDPKRVELAVYNGIPHLLTPVITDVKKTINALKWCLNEMDRRFTLLEAVRCRDIHTYNNGRESERLPFIVVIIDELADLMVTAGAEVEPAIIRLAQMARAVGIHLIVATQRPSVDIITGLIKANITSRIAFAVASQTDSRTILDTSGAEKLLGRGDMLFVNAELSKPKRLQGAYVGDEEIRRVVDHLKTHGGEPDYDASVVEKMQTHGESEDGGGHGGEDSDPMLPLARDCVIRAGKASASLLQRRLRLGYARAARILDLLESQGVIGPADGARPRDVLVRHDDAALSEDREGDIVEESSEEVSGEAEPGSVADTLEENEQDSASN